MLCFYRKYQEFGLQVYWNSIQLKFQLLFLLWSLKRCRYYHLHEFVRLQNLYQFLSYYFLHKRLKR